MDRDKTAERVQEREQIILKNKKAVLNIIEICIEYVLAVTSGGITLEDKMIILKYKSKIIKGYLKVSFSRKLTQENRDEFVDWVKEAVAENFTSHRVPGLSSLQLVDHAISGIPNTIGFFAMFGTRKLDMFRALVEKQLIKTIE